MGSRYDYILAKSESNGATSLKSHLESVAFWAQTAARYAGMDENVVRIGALLHDIGKASPFFQIRLQVKKKPNEKVFRHEVASLLWRANLCATFLGNLVYPTPASKMLHFP